MTSGVQLAWVAPTAPTRTPGDAVDHYNVYRDGTAADGPHRHRRRGGLHLDSTSAPAAMPHTYYVTAVDRHLAESPMLGPVTR